MSVTSCLTSKSYPIVFARPVDGCDFPFFDFVDSELRRISVTKLVFGKPRVRDLMIRTEFAGA